MVGVRSSLAQKQVWALRFFLERDSGFVIQRCSTSPSIAGAQGAIW